MTREEITVYDNLGRAFAFAKEQWKDDVLPRLLEEAWDDADLLRSRVRGALHEGCAEELMAAAERLVAIDDDVVAAAVLYAEVTRRAGDPEPGKKALLSLLTRRPDAAEPRVFLATLARDEGDIQTERELLSAALDLDPNIEPAMLRLLELAGLDCDDEVSGLEARQHCLDQLCQREDAWLPRACIARELLDQGRVDEALDHYERLVAVLPRDSRAITRVTGDLGVHGCTRELVDWFVDNYDTETCGIYAGMNLVQALIAEGEIKRADDLLGQLFEIEAPQCVEHLTVLDAELSSLRRPPEIDAARLQLALIEGPVWAHGLPDTDGILPKLPASSERVLLLGLVDATREAPEPVLETVDEFGTFSRALPLYLAEALRFLSDADPATLLPGIPGAGPVLPSQAWDLDALRNAVRDEGLPEIVVEGKLVCEDGENRVLVFHVHDLRVSCELASFRIPIFGSVERATLEIERELLDALERIGRVRRRLRTGIWQRPRVEECATYLRAHEFLLAQAFVSNHWIDVRSLRDESRIYQSFFTLGEAMPGARVPQAMLLRSLVEGARYGSRVAPRFVPAMRERLRESLSDGALHALRPLDEMLEDGGWRD